VDLTPIQILDGGQHIVQRRRRGQALEIGAKAGFTGGLELAADLHVRGGIVAHQYDAKAGRPSGARGKRVHGGAKLRPDLIRNGRAVQYACTHQ
jgi:hypothetical protein